MQPGTVDLMRESGANSSGEEMRRVSALSQIDQVRTRQKLKIAAPKEGNLAKLSHSKLTSLFTPWQTRRITLQDGIFRYFKDNKCMGCLNFDLYLV